MREVADATRIRRFMRALGAEADVEGAAYLTGGGTAVLVGWRDATVDVDLKLVPETDRMLRALTGLKDDLRINVELAASRRLHARAGRLGGQEPLIERAEGVAYFERIEPELYRFPAIDPRSFRARVEQAFGT